MRFFLKEEAKTFSIKRVSGFAARSIFAKEAAFFTA
jgi:hypothetical protein